MMRTILGVPVGAVSTFCDNCLDMDGAMGDDSTCWGGNLAGQGGQGPYVLSVAGLGLFGARPSGRAHLLQTQFHLDDGEDTCFPASMANVFYDTLLDMDGATDEDSTCWGSNLAGRGGQGPYVLHENGWSPVGLLSAI